MTNVGEKGSVYRCACTVPGEAVNLASRLEGLTKFYGVKCLIGEQTLNGMEGLVCRLMGKVKVKGKEKEKEKAVKIYEPICLAAEETPEFFHSIEVYESALNSYFGKDWELAQSQFEELQMQFPQVLLYKIYLEIIESSRHEILPDDWDGSYQHMSK